MLPLFGCRTPKACGMDNKAGWVECPRYCTGTKRGTERRKTTQPLSTQPFSYFFLQVFVCRNMLFCKEGDGGVCCSDLQHSSFTPKYLYPFQLAFLCSPSAFSSVLSLHSLSTTHRFFSFFGTSQSCPCLRSSSEPSSSSRLGFMPGSISLSLSMNCASPRDSEVMSIGFRIRKNLA